MVSVPVVDEPTEIVEAPWVAPGEIRIGSSVITVDSRALDAGSFTLLYNITSLAPTRAVMNAEDIQLSPPVLPERWVLETINGPVTATSSLTSDSVRFPLDSGLTFDDLASLRLESWKTIVPIAYDISRSETASASTHNGTYAHLTWQKLRPQCGRRTDPSEPLQMATVWHV
jgi:hypothetical protein